MLHTGGSGLGQVNLRLKLGQMHKIALVFFKNYVKTNLILSVFK